MKRFLKPGLLVALILCLPQLGRAQGVADEIGGLQKVLEALYEEMLPLCAQLIGVGRGVAGFAATFYIAVRVWGQIARAEPVDLYPLLRPFVLGFAVLIFPSVIGLLNGVLKPTVTATAAMVTHSNAAIETLLRQKEAAIQKTIPWQLYVGPEGTGDREQWYRYTHPDDPDGDKEGWFESMGNDIKFAMAKASYNFRNSVKEWMSEVLQVLFQGAALCINTIRTFYLVVLAILGPLVFGLSVFDGLGGTLSAWIARYINIFLWLPVANIFGVIIGKVQEKMIALDLQEIAQAGDTFFSPADTAYLIFMLIGIVGYFTVPSLANYIVQAGGSQALLHKVTHLFSASSTTVLQTASGGLREVTHLAGSGLGAASTGLADHLKKDHTGSTLSYQRDRLSGRTK